MGPQASRLDLYADFGGWVIVQGDRLGLVTHADLRAHFRAGTDEVETIQARYLGTIPLSRLKQYPMTLDGVFGRAS
jgi:hypothetical protein